MDIRDGSRHCPVYATQRLKYFGMEVEELALGVVSFVVLQMLINVVLAMLIAILLVRAIMRATAGKPPGYMVHAASLSIGRLANSDNKTVANIFSNVSVAIGDMWKKSGSLPPPTSINKY